MLGGMGSSCDRDAINPDLLFYDGHCGLCHGLVRFAAVRHPTCRYAPLGGPTYRARIPEERRQTLPNSVILLHGDRLLTRSDAVLQLLRPMGPGWATLALLGRLLPRRLRDAAYDRLARWRRRLFLPPGGSCPLPAVSLRKRLDP
jgi:predicted DCC family thiol-disulfide oxidoreductase YuxK